MHAATSSSDASRKLGISDWQFSMMKIAEAQAVVPVSSSVRVGVAVLVPVAVAMHVTEPTKEQTPWRPEYTAGHVNTCYRLVS